MIGFFYYGKNTFSIVLHNSEVTLNYLCVRMVFPHVVGPYMILTYSLWDPLIYAMGCVVSKA